MMKQFFLLLFLLSSITNAFAQQRDGFVSQQECRTLMGVWRMALPNCRCPHDESIALDPKASDFSQARQKCNLHATASGLAQRAASLERGIQSVSRSVTLSCPVYLESFLDKDKVGYRRPFIDQKAPAVACGNLAQRRRFLRNATELETFLAQEPYTSVKRPVNLAQSCLPSSSEASRSFFVTEYYYLMQRIKVALANHLDEIALIDLAIGSNSLLNGVSCSFPQYADVERLCHEIKSNTRCNQLTPVMPKLAADTEAIEKNLAPINNRIKDLEFKKSGSMVSHIPFIHEDELRKLKQERERMLSTLPWLKGATYKRSRSAKKSISASIRDQLTANRPLLLERITTLKSAIQCLDASRTEQAKCKKFEDIIAEYTEDLELPPLEELSPRMAEVAAEFNRVECHRNQRKDIADARRKFRQVTAFGLLTAVSFGSGSIAGAIISQIPRASVAVRSAILATSIGIPEAVWIGMDIKTLTKECSNFSSLQASNYQIQSNSSAPACAQGMKYGQAITGYSKCATSAALAIGSAALGGAAIRGTLGAARSGQATTTAVTTTVSNRAAQTRTAARSLNMSQAQIREAREALQKYMQHHHEAMLARGRNLERTIRTSKAPVHYDVIVVGAGPHNSIAVAAIKEVNPNFRILVIEATDNLGVFHSIKGFDINTKELLTRSGNGFPASPVQLKDFNFTDELFASAEGLGQLTQATYQYADVDMIFRNPVVKWSKEPRPGAWPGMYKVETGTGVTVYTNSGLVGTGFGSPIHRLTDAGSVAIWNKHESLIRSTNFATNAGFAPGVQSVDNFLTVAQRDVQLGRNSMARYRGKKVMVIGGGDGGNIAVEGTTGLNRQLNPTGADTGVETIWLNQKHKTGNEFRNSLSERLKPRYERIADAFDDGRVIPVDGRIVRIEEFTRGRETKFRVFYSDQAGKAVTEPIVVDHLVFATGYTNNHSSVSPIFAGMVGQGNRSDDLLFRHLDGRVDEFTPYREFRTTQPITARLEVSGVPENVFMTGQVANTPITDAQWEIPVGGFIDILGPRSAATGTLLAHSLAPQRLSRFEVIRQLTPASGTHLQYIPLRVRNAPNPQITNLIVADVDTKIELGKVLRNFKSAPHAQFKMVITEGSVRIDGLAKTSADEIIASIRENQPLMESLAHHFRLGRKELEISVRFRSTGNIKLEDLVIAH
jgi:uncharacterized small protein (DUF1192 family)